MRLWLPTLQWITWHQRLSFVLWSSSSLFSQYALIIVHHQGICLWMVDEGYTRPFSNLSFLYSITRSIGTDSWWSLCHSPFFQVTMQGVHLPFPISFVESSSFSFCHLLYRLHTLLSQIQSVPPTDEGWAFHASMWILWKPPPSIMSPRKRKVSMKDPNQFGDASKKVKVSK